MLTIAKGSVAKVARVPLPCVCCFRAEMAGHAVRLFLDAPASQRMYVYIRMHAYVYKYACMYVHTCYVLIKPHMPIHYVLAAVFTSCFYVLKSLLHE
jgi:hypothetical protein